MNMSLGHFAQAKDINDHVFKKYAHANKKNRHTIGKDYHRPTIMTTDKFEFICDIAIRADRARRDLMCPGLVLLLMSYLFKFIQSILLNVFKRVSL